ncbi:hypothetical protein JCM10213v2_007049 [Rhodosporidiobolus nylandii]
MPTAVEYKTEGNAAFAAKKWLKATKLYTKALEAEQDEVASAAILSNRSAAYVYLQDYDKALADANLAVIRRSDWSKAYARAAEVHARLQDFHSAEHKQAIQRAEDDAAKGRYETSLKTTQEAAAKAMPKDNHSSLRSASEQDIWPNKLEQRVKAGYVLRNGQGLMLSLHAYHSCKQGMEQLDDVLKVRHPNGTIEGNLSSQVVPNIAECILLDEHGFFVPYGKDPKFPLGDKFNLIVISEIRYHGGDKYFMNARWSAKDIIADMDKRLKTEGRERIRRLCSQLIRGLVIMSFSLSVKNEQGAAIAQIKLAIALHEEGNRVWADVPFEEKARLDAPLLWLETYPLRLIHATRDAKTVSAKRMFTLEAVEDLAKQILKENKEEDWPAHDGRTTLIAYHVMPAWEAYSALAFVYSVRAQKPLCDIPGGKAAFADLELAAKAASYYDKAANLMPDDWHNKAQHMWYAMELHLRAGGLSVAALLRRVEAAERVEAETEGIFIKEPMPYGPREFVSMQLDSIKTTLASVGDLTRVTGKIKAVPTVALNGAPRSFDLSKELGREEFWEGKPGAIGIADIVGSRR